MKIILENIRHISEYLRQLSWGGQFAWSEQVGLGLGLGLGSLASAHPCLYSLWNLIKYWDQSKLGPNKT